jgi:hypothetical protein
MIAKPIKVKALEKYSIFVEFSDGVGGVVDLSHLARKGVFREWDEGRLFDQVHLGTCGEIAWNENIDICPNRVYLLLRGMTFEQWQNQKEHHAANQ